MKIALVLVALTSLIVLGGTHKASAWIDAPYNGGFDGSATGWTAPWTPGDPDCGYDSSVGYGAAGSMRFDYTTGNACVYDSLAVHATQTWSLRVMSRSTATEVCGLLIELILVSNPNTVTTMWTGGYTQANLWFQTDFSNLPAGDHYIRLHPSIVDVCTVYIDDVQAIGTTGSTPSGTPTPGATATPGPTSTPGPTPLPGATVISGNAARSAVSLGTPVPYFNPSTFENPMIPVNLNGNTNPQVAVVGMSNRSMSACLPSQVTQVFSDVELCLSIPLVSVDELSFAGFDLIPSLSIASSVLLFVFLVTRLRSR